MCNTKQSQTLGGAILGFSIARTISPPFDDVIFIADVTLVSGDDVITLPLSGSVEGVFERWALSAELAKLVLCLGVPWLMSGCFGVAAPPGALLHTR